MNPQELLAAAEAGTLDLDSDEPTIQAPAQQQVEETTEQPSTKAAPEQEQSEVEAPIASKSGAYTIPFEKLAHAREQAKALAAENEQLRQQLEQLSAAQAANLAQAQAQAQDRADAGQAATQEDANLAAAQQAVAQGVDPAIFGDFSEEAIAKGVQALVEQGVQRAIAPIIQERQVQQQQDAVQSHYSAIYEAHPDANELAQSAEFAAWRESLPGFARAAVDRTLAEGEAPEVVEVFSTFKQQAAIPSAGSKVKAAIATAKAAAVVPASLSELTGQAASANPAETIVALAEDPQALQAYMSELTPEQREKLMNSVGR